MAEDSDICQLPNSICFHDNLLTIDTHPNQDIVATGTMDGSVSLYSYSKGTDCCLISSMLAAGESSCRAVRFSKAGQTVIQHLFPAQSDTCWAMVPIASWIMQLECCSSHMGVISSCSFIIHSVCPSCVHTWCVHHTHMHIPGIYAVYKNKKFVAMDAGVCQVLHFSADAHCSPINALHCVSQRLLATGDEDGCVKVWDSRLWKPVFSVHENTDFISDMVSIADKNTLLCSSGDGSLSAIDLRQRKLEERSDCCESELLSLATVKGGSKVVSGDGEGVLGIYTWGLWGDITDRFPCHLQSVDSCIQTSDSVVCTGCADGTIRAIQILPNKVITVVGQHCMDYAVDNLCLSHDGQYLMSGSYSKVSFWKAETIPKLYVKNMAVKDEETDSGDAVGEEEERKRKRKRRKRRKIQKQIDKPRKLKEESDFFADL